ncbi:MAG: Smr/MutS family protein [Gammaproteobacteria bacterium]|nr:Smr/MutS family protein [Gammaproteobacteria bacterium]
MPKKTTAITDEERNLFRDAVSDVKPRQTQTTTKLEPTVTISPEETITIKIKPISLKKRDPIPEKSTFHFKNHQPNISGNDIISFSKSGLQHKKFSKLKQGKIRIEATLDLHDHTSDEAIHATEIFLKRCQNIGFRAVCIIHGKGIYSNDNKPVLKNLLNNLLRENPCVLAFHSAKNYQGGTGAVVVIIKAR